MISFFAKPAYVSISNRLQRGSSLIRGNQVAEYLGAKLNPIESNGDVRIYVKPTNLEGIEGGSYIDMVDGTGFIRMLAARPDLNVIVMSQAGKEHLEKLLRNKVVVIPQHHCNIENLNRNRDEIKTVGVIGSVDSFECPADKFKEEMEKIGLEFITCHDFKSREEVVDFYKRIDIQVSWNTSVTRQKLFRDSLRIKNAASFGIPTVAYPEINWKEFEGGYIRVESTDELIAEVGRLKDKDYYSQWSDKAARMASGFHIGMIAKQYLSLEVS